MHRVVSFPLPHTLSVEEKHYIGKSSLGMAIVIKRNPTKIACTIKDYILKTDAIVFMLDVLDPELEYIMDSGDPAPQYEWINPIESMTLEL